MQVHQYFPVEDMSTPMAYEMFGKDYGLELVDFVEMTENLAMHFRSVRTRFFLHEIGVHMAGSLLVGATTAWRIRP